MPAADTGGLIEQLQPVLRHHSDVIVSAQGVQLLSMCLFKSDIWTALWERHAVPRSSQVWPGEHRSPQERGLACCCAAAVPHLMVGVGRVAAAGQTGSGDADREARVAERADRRGVLRSLRRLLRIVDGIHQVCSVDPRVACSMVVHLGDSVVVMHRHKLPTETCAECGHVRTFVVPPLQAADPAAACVTCR